MRARQQNREINNQTDRQRKEGTRTDRAVVTQTDRQPVVSQSDRQPVVRQTDTCSQNRQTDRPIHRPKERHTDTPTYTDR